jgi:Lon protease-like protein
MNPKLSRALYRTFLRASHNGLHPEVFGRHGAAVLESQIMAQEEHASLAIPSKPAQVRQRLKDYWRNVNPNLNLKKAAHSDSPLMVLESVHQQESLLPTTGNSNSKTALPIFDYDGVAALPGETTQMVFLEPRYLSLAASVLQEDSTGHFLMRASPKSSTATLVQMLSHLVLPTNMVAVACRGGARVHITQETSQQVPGELDPILAEKHKIDKTQANCLKMATNYEWKQDTSCTTTAQLMHTRQYILDMLSVALPLQESALLTTLAQFGLPPLQPEPFSFWALRYVLAPNDVSSRLFWLQSTHTADRMNYVVQELESILDQEITPSHHQTQHQKQQQQSLEESVEDDDEEEEVAVASFA